MHKRGTRGGLIADLHAVVEDAEALLKATSAEGGEKIEGLRTRVEQPNGSTATSRLLNQVVLTIFQRRESGSCPDSLPTIRTLACLNPERGIHVSHQQGVFQHPAREGSANRCSRR